MGYSIFTDTMVDMPWPEVEAAARRGAIVLLPVGIIEEHGPHLGLAVDTYAAYLIAVKARRELAERGIEALVAPPQYWGVSKATATFGGTFSVRRETMQALIVDIIASLGGWGFKKVFTVNWHADGEHVKAILAAVNEARDKTGVDARFVVEEYDVRRLRLTGDEEAVLVQLGTPDIDTGKGPYIDVHAGSLETAVMMKYFPDGLDAEYIRGLEDSKLTWEDMKGFGRSDEETRRLVPDGYFGNPAGYDTAIAEATIEVDVQSYADAVEHYVKHGA